MKYLLLTGLIVIPLIGFNQIRFTGYIKDASGSHKPISDAQISVKGSNVTSENILSSDADGFFVIKFDNNSVNKDFVLKISHKDFNTGNYSEVVVTTLQPKTYYLKSKNPPRVVVKKKQPSTEVVKKKPSDVEDEKKKQETAIEKKPQPAPVEENTPVKNEPPINQVPKDSLNEKGDRFLTEIDKRTIKEQLVDHKSKVFVYYQRGNEEAKDYANMIVRYVKSIGYNAVSRFYQPPEEGRFTITAEDRVYNINVLVRIK